MLLELLFQKTGKSFSLFSSEIDLPVGPVFKARRNQRRENMARPNAKAVSKGEPRIYSFLNDFVFKWLFGQEKNAKFTICLLNALLHLERKRKIKEVTILNPFNEKEFKEEKLSVVDVKVQDHLGRIYIVELQVLRDRSFVQRSIYYLAKVYSRQLKSGQHYRNLQPVTAISILGFNLFKRSDKIQEIFNLINQEGTLKLDKTLELHYVDLTRFNKDKPRICRTRFEKWLHVLKFGHLYGKMEAELDEELKAEEGVSDMVSEFKKINADEEKRQLMEAREKSRDALKIIKGDSFTRGHKKGHQKGKIEGKIEGKVEGKIEVALKMHAAGRSIEEISDFTGLTPAELQKLFSRP